MIEKYIKFYKSVKQFLFDCNLSLDDTIEGENIDAISQFEKEYKIKFPVSIYAYLLYFGKKINLRNVETEKFFTLKNVKHAMDTAENGNYKSILQRKDGLQDYYGDDGDIKLIYEIVDIEKVIFINQQDFRDGIGFIDCSDENPHIYYLFQKEYYLGENKTFSNYIRETLFQMIHSRFYSDAISTENYTESMIYMLNETKKINLDKIDWAKVYTKCKVENILSDTFYRNQRLNFYKIIEEREKQTGYIMTVDEFEWAFIDYLKEQGVLNKIMDE